MSAETTETTETTAAAGTAAADDPSASAAIRVAGNATPEELAALVVVLSALGDGGEPPAEHDRSAWSDPSWRLVGPSRSHGGWRASGLPR